MRRTAVPEPDASQPVRRAMSALQDELETLIAGYQGGWQVYCEDLATGASLSINNHQGYSASLIKLYVMLAVYQRIDDGALAEDARIEGYRPDCVSGGEVIRPIGTFVVF